MQGKFERFRAVRDNNADPPVGILFAQIGEQGLLILQALKQIEIEVFNIKGEWFGRACVDGCA